MEGTKSVHVKGSPEAVFAYVADLENAPEWVPDLVSVTKVGGGEVGVGTRYTEVVQMGGKRGDAELEITEYDPPRVMAHKGQGGPSRFTARFVVTPDGDGVRIDHHYTVEMTGFAKLLAPVASRWVAKNTEAGMERLKAVLEERARS